MALPNMLRRRFFSEVCTSKVKASTLIDASNSCAFAQRMLPTYRANALPCQVLPKHAMRLAVVAWSAQVCGWRVVGDVVDRAAVWFELACRGVSLLIASPSLSVLLFCGLDKQHRPHWGAVCSKCIWP